MHITLVIGGLGGGGAERVCINLANCWVERGHHVTILTLFNSATPAYAIDSRVQRRSVDWPRLPRDEEIDATAVESITRGLHQAGVRQLTEDITFFALLRNRILAQRPDVVVSHMDVTNLRVLIAMYETNLPVVACEHTDATRISIGWWQSLRAALLPRASFVVTPHTASVDWFSKYDVKVVGIPNPLIPPSEVSRDERNGQRRRLVSVSRLSPEKRPDLSVRAFASIAGDFPDWDFEIYGDGPMRATVSDLIKKLAPDRIELHGFTRNPYDVLSGADLFVSSSWVEGFGNSIWEAMACGVPVVVTEAGTTIRSLVRDRVDGMISNDTVPALARDLATLMSDDVRRAEMAERAREVVTRFSLEGALAAWDKVLSEAAK
jgi:glycosyltransferase involved in cell wall biosynthesis